MGMVAMLKYGEESGAVVGLRITSKQINSEKQLGLRVVLDGAISKSHVRSSMWHSCHIGKIFSVLFEGI